MLQLPYFVLVPVIGETPATTHLEGETAGCLLKTLPRPAPDCHDGEDSLERTKRLVLSFVVLPHRS